MIHPVYIAIKITITDFFPKCSMIRPDTYAAIMYARIYPPVGPTITPRPPENPLNTGKPTIPIKAYVNWLSAPYFDPSSPAATKVEI